MRVINVTNVNRALPEGLALLKAEGTRQESRAGDVLVLDQPVTTVYRRPRERVLFLAERDCNPFLHLLESVWMLAGREDVAFLKQFTRNMEKFSDNSVTLRGAYGHRWRMHFGHDQLRWAVDRLRTDPNDRRVVIGMYDPDYDHRQCDRRSLDIPCNLQIALRVVRGALDMTVFNRSNDIVWGAYGANAVHMSYLQEYVASALGVSVGAYRQVSNNFHAYTSVYAKYGTLSSDDRYTRGTPIWPLMDDSDADRFDVDLKLFFEDPFCDAYHNTFFTHVARPMYAAHRMYKENRGMARFSLAQESLAQMPKGLDWRIAGEEWIARRWARWERKNDDGVHYES